MVEVAHNRRVWFRFSLRSLFVVMTLVALVVLQMPFWTEFEVLTVDIHRNVRITSGWDVQPMPQTHWTDSIWFWKVKRIAVKLLPAIAVLTVYLAWETRSRMVRSKRLSTALPDRRRRLQFGIGSIFLVVTMFAVWLGWEMNWIRQRHALLENDKVFVSSVGIPWEGVPPAPLGWFGESGVGTSIILPSATTDDELNRVRRLFPRLP